MSTSMTAKELLLAEMEKLHARKVLSESIPPDYFEPGMMEYLDQSDGLYNNIDNTIELWFESRGTRYGDRTELIESLRPEDPIIIERDSANRFNSNNFVLKTSSGKDVGNMPAELCNVIAPLYDSGELFFEESKVSFVDPISKRSRNAKQSVLFVHLKCRLK